MQAQDVQPLRCSEVTYKTKQTNWDIYRDSETAVWKNQDHEMHITSNNRRLRSMHSRKIQTRGFWWTTYRAQSWIIVSHCTLTNYNQGL